MFQKRFKTVSVLFQRTILRLGAKGIVEVNRMKAWKFALAIGLAVIAVALVCVSVFAYTGAQGFYSPYATNAHDAYSNGMMGEAYGAPQSPTQPNPATPTYPYQYQYGYGGCGGRYSWNGCAGPAYP
jgi:hypothetical protein